MQENFRRKATTVGSSVGFTVPAHLVHTKKIEKGKEYDLTVSDEVVSDGGLQ